MILSSILKHSKSIHEKSTSQCDGTLVAGICFNLLSWTRTLVKMSGPNRLSGNTKYPLTIHEI